MMLLRALYSAAVFALTTAAAAQIDPEDFVDPRQHEKPVFIFRAVLGGAANLSDHYRPLEQNVGFLHMTGSLYWTQFQFDYKHTELHGTDHNDPLRVRRCSCNPPVFFPTPPPDGAIPAAPLPGSIDTLQAGWYRLAGSGEQKVALRYRLTARYRRIGAVIEASSGNSRMSGRELSIGLDADTYLPIGNRGHFGTLHYARTESQGTIDDRSQHEITYTARFPGAALARVLIQPTLTVGGVSDRGGTIINVVNPSFEALVHEPKTEVNFHLVYSPQLLNSELEGWRTTHQIALFVDRSFVHLFR